MAKGNETTTKFKVDISELKKSMQEARKQVAYANSEFKATASSMDDWSKSSDGISAKLKQLKSNLKSQETVLAEYEKTLQEVKKEYGENSKEALEYATKLNNQKAVVNKAKKEIAGYEESLQKVSKAEKIAAKTGKDVADVLDDVGNEADGAGDGFTVLKGAVAEFVGSGLTALVGGIKDAISSFMSLADETREYREDMNKLETAFTTAGFTTDQATKVYKDFYAVLGEEDRSVEAVSHLAKLVHTEKDLNTWTNICTGVWATFGDSLPIEGLTEASNETAKTGQLTGVLADALNWAGKSEDEFQAKLDSLNTEQERAAFITDTLNGLYSTTANEYRKNNKSIMDANKAQSDYTDTLAEMGETAEPVMTALKIGVTDLLKEFLKLVSDVDMEAFTAKIQEGFGILKDDVLPAVKDGLGWILDNKDSIVAGLVAIGGGFAVFQVASMIQGVVTAVKAYQAANEGATVAQAVLNTVMGANPMIKIVGIILAVVTALITFIATNEDARAKIVEVWGKITNAVSTGIQYVTGFFKNLISWVRENWQSLLTFLVNPFAGLFKYFYDNNKKFKEFVDNAIKYIKELPTKVWTWLTNTITKINTWRADMVTKAREAGLNFINKVIEFVSQLPAKVWTWLVNTITQIVQWRVDLERKAIEAGKGFVNNLIEAVSGLPDKMKSIGSNIVSGIWNGISSGWSWLRDKVSGLASSLYESAKEALGIHSPSKVFADEVGKWIPAGIAVGIDKNAKTALNSVRDLAINTLGGASAGLKTATTSLGGGGAIGGGVVNNFYQTINAPKQLSRLDIYRQSKNLLGYAGGGY